MTICSTCILTGRRPGAPRGRGSPFSPAHPPQTHPSLAPPKDPSPSVHITAPGGLLAVVSDLASQGGEAREARFCPEMGHLFLGGGGGGGGLRDPAALAGSGILLSFHTRRQTLWHSSVLGCSSPTLKRLVSKHRCIAAAGTHTHTLYLICISPAPGCCVWST